MARMNKTKLGELFGATDSEEVIDVPAVPVKVNPPTLYDREENAVTEGERNADLRYARKSLQDLIEKGHTLVDTAIEHAEEGGSKDVEAAAAAVSATADSIEKLVKIHKHIADVEKPTQVNIGQQQVLNVTTNDLLEAVLKRNEELPD